MEKDKIAEINQLIFQAQGGYYGYDFIEYMIGLPPEAYSEQRKREFWENLKKKADDSSDALVKRYMGGIFETTRNVLIELEGEKYLRKERQFNKAVKNVLEEYSIPIFKRIVRGDDFKNFSVYLTKNRKESSYKEKYVEKKKDLNYGRIGGLYKRWLKEILFLENVRIVKIPSLFAAQRQKGFSFSHGDYAAATLLIKSQPNASRSLFDDAKTKEFFGWSDDEAQQFNEGFWNSLNPDSLWVCHEIKQTDEVIKRNFSLHHKDGLFRKKKDVILALHGTYMFLTMFHKHKVKLSLNKKKKIKKNLDGLHAIIEESIPSKNEDSLGSKKGRNLTTYLFGYKKSERDRGILFYIIKDLVSLKGFGMSGLLGLDIPKKVNVDIEKNYPQDKEGFDEDFIRKQELEEALKLLEEKIGHTEYRILYLRIVEEWNWQDIADDIGKSRKTVHKIVRKLKEKYPALAKYLSKYHYSKKNFS